MAVVTIKTSTGIAAATMTPMALFSLGGSVLDGAKVITTTVQSDTSGNFTVDITSAGLSTIIGAWAQVVTGLAAPATNATVSNTAEAHISSASATTITGYVVQPATVSVLGALSIKLSTAQLSVMLWIVGT